MPDVIAEATVLEAADSLILHEQNPRQGDVGAIVESIEANGFYAPLIVQRSTRHVLAGNHRLLAARQLGMGEVPVVWVDVDDDRALRILLADNRTADLAAYDDVNLAALLTDLAQCTTTQLLGSGYDSEDLDSLLADVTSPFNPNENGLGALPDALPDGGGVCPSCRRPLVAQ